MQLQPKAVEYFIFGLLIWLAFLSFIVFKAVAHYKRLTKGTNNQDLVKIIEKMINKQNQQIQQYSQLLQEQASLKNIQKTYFQKSALVRFNPFEDSGGDQSFTLALLDGTDKGYVISSLHSRNSTRIYAKEVIGAKAKSHQFSKEEKEAVDKACLVESNSISHV